VVLYSVGRLDEADEIYRSLDARSPGPLRMIDAAVAQAGSLTNRGRRQEAHSLGVRVLHDLGFDLDARRADAAEFDAAFERLRAWVESFDLERECAREDTTDERVTAAAKMICSLQANAFFGDQRLFAVLVFLGQELWAEYGPCAPLAATLTSTNVVTTTLRQDWRTGYLGVRRILDMCEARGWEPETSRARYHFVLTCAHWFEPMERRLRECERAKEGLLAGGDLRDASFADRNAAISLLECGASLDACEDEIEAALALAMRSDNRDLVHRLTGDRQLVRALRGETAGGRFEGEGFNERSYLEEASSDPGIAYYTLNRAVACAVFGEYEELCRLAAVAFNSLKHVPCLYPTAWAYWMQGLAAAWRLQSSGGPTSVFQELDACITWLRRRAVDAPFNFRHLHLHLAGERARALGDGEAAARMIDEALSALEATQRPWHRALILERAASLHLQLGWAHSAARLQRESTQAYASWGAWGKVGTARAHTNA
jgi:hypothetical protein